MFQTDIRHIGFVAIIFHWTQNWTALNSAVNFQPLIRLYWPSQVYSPIKGIEFEYDPKNQNVRGHQGLIRGHFTIFSTIARILWNRHETFKHLNVFQNSRLFEYRARNLIFWMGLVILQTKNMLRPHCNVSTIVYNQLHFTPIMTMHFRQF